MLGGRKNRDEKSPSNSKTPKVESADQVDLKWTPLSMGETLPPQKPGTTGAAEDSDFAKSSPPTPLEGDTIAPIASLSLSDTIAPTLSLSDTIAPTLSLSDTIAPIPETLIGDPSRGRSHRGFTQSTPSKNTEEALGEVDRNLYEFGEEMARGGMGRILLAEDCRLRRPVAIKELLHDHEVSRQRFEREAFITARLQHPGIVNIYEAGRWKSGEYFYAMEKINGKSLDEVIEGTQSFNERLNLLPHIIDVADAMSYAHSQRVIHRDLKPANILVGSFGETIVIDWGLAKVIGEADPNDLQEAPLLDGDGQLTLAGSIMGTPAYMPPEQAQGLEVDERVDVYAIGAMLYHLLCGEVPYPGQGSRQILMNLLANTLPPISERVAEVPSELASIIDKSMHTDLGLRYRDAGALALELKQFQAGKMVSSHHYSIGSLVRRKFERHRLPLTIAAIAFLTILVLSVLSILQILDAEQRASEELEAANLAKTEANTARMDAVKFNSDLILSQAREAIVKGDPAAAIAWLKNLDEKVGDWGAARMIAARAQDMGAAEHVLRGHHGISSRVVLAPGGKHLISSSTDGTIRRWDLLHRTHQIFRQDSVGLRQWFALDADATHAVTTTRDGAVALLDFEADTTRLLPNLGKVSHVAFNRDGALALALSNDTLCIYNFDAQKCGESVDMAHKITALRFTPNGLSLSVGDDSGASFLLNAITLEKKGKTSGDGPVTAVGFSKNEEWRFSLDENQHPFLEQLSPRPRQVPLEFLKGEKPTAFAFSADNRWFAIAHGEHVSLVDLQNESLTTISKRPPNLTKASRTLSSSRFVDSLRFSSNGIHLASASGRSGVQVWHLPSPPGHEKIHDFRNGIVFSFSRKGDTLVTTHRDRTIRVRDLSRAVPRTFYRPKLNPTALASAPDGTLYIANKDGEVWSWGPKKDAQLLLETKGAPITAIERSPDGKTLAISTSKDTSLWNIEGAPQKPPTMRQSHQNQQHARFSPDGKWIVAVSPAQIHLENLSSRRRYAFGNTKNTFIALGGPSSADFAYTKDIRSKTTSVRATAEPVIIGGGVGVQNTLPSASSSASSPKELKTFDNSVLPQSKNSRSKELRNPSNESVNRQTQGFGGENIAAGIALHKGDGAEAGAAEETVEERRLRDEDETTVAKTSPTRSEVPLASLKPTFKPQNSNTSSSLTHSDPTSDSFFGKEKHQEPLSSDAGGKMGNKSTKKRTKPKDAWGSSHLSDKRFPKFGEQKPKSNPSTDKQTHSDDKALPKDPLPPGSTPIALGVIVPDADPQTPQLSRPTHKIPAPSPLQNHEEFTASEDMYSGVPIVSGDLHPHLQMNADERFSNNLQFSPNGQWLAAPLPSGGLSLWNLKDTTIPPQSIPIPSKERVNDLTFSADSSQLFIASGEGKITLYKLADGTTEELDGAGYSVAQIAISPDGQWLSGVLDRGLIRVWRLDDGSWFDLTLEAGHIPLLQFSPDSKQLAAAGKQRIFLWDLQSHEMRDLGAHQDTILALSFVPDGVATISADHTVRRWRDDLPHDPKQLRAWLNSDSSAQLDEKQCVTTLH